MEDVMKATIWKRIKIVGMWAFSWAFPFLIWGFVEKFGFEMWGYPLVPIVLLCTIGASLGARIGLFLFTAHWETGRCDGHRTEFSLWWTYNQRVVVGGDVLCPRHKTRVVSICLRCGTVKVYYIG